jgi:membrane protein DedA with SNARE-associated domain
MPVVRTFISLPAGVALMDLRSFTLFTAAGSFLWSLMLVSAGYALGANYERIRQFVSRFDVPIAAAILLLIALYVYLHIRQQRLTAKA